MPPAGHPSYVWAVWRAWAGEQRLLAGNGTFLSPEHSGLSSRKGVLDPGGKEGSPGLRSPISLPRDCVSERVSHQSGWEMHPPGPPSVARVERGTSVRWGGTRHHATVLFLLSWGPSLAYHLPTTFQSFLWVSLCSSRTTSLAFLKITFTKLKCLNWAEVSNRALCARRATDPHLS